MDWKHIRITDGTEQGDRPSDVLRPGYFNVDELSFENLLAMAADFANEIPFHNLQNKADGDWGDMFEADEAVIMAMILSIDLKLIEAKFQRLRSREPARLADFLFELASRFNHWQGRLELSRHASGEMLARKIASLIDEKLTAELNGLRGLLAQQDFSGFSANWQEPEAQPPVDTKNLSASFYVFLNAISYIKQSAEQCLAQSLTSAEHNPATGLFLVFLKLYAEAQKQINGFTLRHLDFYYRKMLKAENRNGQPQSYFLALQPQARSGQVYLESDTEFSLGKDAQRNAIVYRTDNPVLVREVEVAALATLYFQHDRLISPEAELGFVTRIKSAKLPAINTGAEPAPLWPLFGAGQNQLAQVKQDDARIGFCIASDLLLLEQGEREIELVIEFKPLSRPALKKMIAALFHADSDREEQFITSFSRLFARYLLNFNGCLSDKQKKRIIERADTVLPAGRAGEIAELLNENWQALFYRSLRRIFQIQLSAESGWLDVPDYILLPYEQNADSKKTGFRLQIKLGQDVVPIVVANAELHGEECLSKLPLMRCRLNPQSHFCGYSLFQELVIDSVQIDVEVRGLKNILAYNQHGQLDASKPFQPFGPMPGRNSYFVFGNYEMAQKPLQSLKIHLDWGELPHDVGGFDEHYHGYSTRFDNQSFEGEFSLLSDSRWQPPYGDSRSFKLFERQTGGSRLQSAKSIEVERLDAFKPIDTALPQEAYQYDLKARNGFMCLSLCAPEQAFGHAEYPQVLTAVLSANARRRKPLAAPKPPYTPMINNLSLDYRASNRIVPSQGGEDQAGTSQRIMQLHPFGITTVYPKSFGEACHLLPQYAYEGNLFIGLRATEIASALTLLFSLSQELSQQGGLTASRYFDWFYLSSNRWKKLTQDCLLSDSTHGFLRSGIVSLKIPPDINRANSVMPGDYFWLRVSVARGAEAFAACYSVLSNAVKVTGVGDNAMQMTATAMKWSPLRSLPGIAGVKHSVGPFGGRATENNAQCVMRLSERLRHKNRALLPSDYEHLILERFPQVFKVKCFNSISSDEDAIKPGRVLIVVVPYAQDEAAGSCARAVFDVRVLDQIKLYLRGLCAPFAQLEVRNPLYEQVQVRCTVRFAHTASEGVNIERLNRHISEYICPWEKSGYNARFGWSIRQQDIESYIRNLDYIDFVTNFSMLHITIDRHGSYSLFDTAKGGQSPESVIRPRYPWSLAVPTQQHFIEASQVAKSIPAEVTGVDELAVGGTFIISGSRGYGEEE